MRLAPLFAGVFACVFAATASAHTPYLAPSTFAPRAGDTVALDASFAETSFVPETVFDNSHFTVTGPDGKEVALDGVQLLKVRAVGEYTLPKGAASTYRFSTGPRLGALFRTWELDGKQESSRDPASKIPAGAKVISNFQSLTLAETYVTVGEPGLAALQPRGKGIELVRPPIRTTCSSARPSTSPCSTTASRWPTRRSRSPKPCGRPIASRRS